MASRRSDRRIGQRALLRPPRAIRLNHKQIVVLARSTDGAHTFTNYAWTDNPFEASGVFFGDYTGLAAYGGRVYGIWTEKPVAKKPEEGKEKEVSESKPQPRGTIVKVGTADFSAPH